METSVGPLVLVSDEELVSVQRCPVLLPASPEPALAVLTRMAGVADAGQIGQAGPVIAALANAENAANPELRRYEALFGRDALYAADALADAFPLLQENTVLHLAGLQAQHRNAASQAERGKIPNHVRDSDDPLAQRLSAERGRRWPWFGATDTTVLFLDAAAQVLARHPDLAHAELHHPAGTPGAGKPVRWAGRPRRLVDAVAAATHWLLDHLADTTSGPVRDLLWVTLNDADSFTTWRDSPNAFSHHDGTLVAPPVAPVGLQGQVHRALLGLADLADGRGGGRPLPLGGLLSAARLRRRAGDVAAAVQHRFVLPDGQGGVVVASALDGRGARPVLARTVDAGFTLRTAVWDGPHLTEVREHLVSTLLGPTMLTPFGIAGRSRDDVRWTPFDYHSQVWGFATHEVSRGLRHLGHRAEADDLTFRLLRQSGDGLLPENVGSDTDGVLRYCGHLLVVRRPTPDGRTTVTVKERPPAPYAAWTAAAIVASQYL